jgi:hypothetical protein
MAISGALSSVTWGGTSVPAIGSASVQITRPTQQITGIGDTVDTFIAGVQSGTASLDLFYDDSNAVHATIMTDLTTATAAKSLIITLATGQTVTCTTSYCTGADFTTSAGQVVRCTCSFQLSGAIAVA